MDNLVPCSSGPWEAYVADGQVFVLDCNGYVVAYCGPASQTMAVANAHLIAKSAQLLSGVRSAISYLKGFEDQEGGLKALEDVYRQALYYDYSGWIVVIGIDRVQMQKQALDRYHSERPLVEWMDEDIGEEINSLDSEKTYLVYATVLIERLRSYLPGMRIDIRDSCVWRPGGPHTTIVGIIDADGEHIPRTDIRFEDVSLKTERVIQGLVKGNQSYYRYLRWEYEPNPCSDEDPEKLLKRLAEARE